MTGAIDKELNKYISQLNAVQKKSLLGFIKTIYTSKDEEAISIEEYNRELEAADAAIERGEYYTNEEIFETAQKMINARK